MALSYSLALSQLLQVTGQLLWPLREITLRPHTLS